MSLRVLQSLMHICNAGQRQESIEEPLTKIESAGHAGQSEFAAWIADQAPEDLLSIHGVLDSKRMRTQRSSAINSAGAERRATREAMGRALASR
jgi:hypothetical protein